MIVRDYKDQFNMFDNMAIWAISSMEEFFTSHQQIEEIFAAEYGFSYSSRNEQAEKFIDTDIMMVSRLLDLFGDKHFFVFSENDAQHIILKELQDKKLISFGMDIYVLKPNHIYVLEMDKTKDLQKYDN